MVREPLLVFLATLPLLAQSPARIPSPFAIREEIASAQNYDLRGLYGTLHLPNVFQVAGEAPNTRLNCLDRSCTANVEQLAELADVNRPTHMLSICWSYSSMCRFVFFHESRRPKTWIVIGYLDASHDAGMLAPGGGNPFLLGYITTRGTGGSYSFERWYDVSAAAITPVHEVVLRGVDANVLPVRSFHALLVSVKSTHMEDILTYVYYVEFSSGTTDPVDTDLFDEHRTVRFSRPKGEGRYKFDRARSEMTEAEIKNFFTRTLNTGAVDPVPSKLLSFARNSLLRIARSGNAAQKQWLANYLAAAPASPIKSEIMRTLAAKGAK